VYVRVLLLRNIKIPIRSRSYDFKVMKDSVVDPDLVRSGIVWLIFWIRDWE
jgi:hypothetical protein